MFWLVLLLFVATTVIGELLAPKGQKPTAGALGDFNFPTAAEGRAIPVVFGTVRIGGGNTVWWGDLLVKAIKKRASFLSFSSQIIGYKYSIGVQYALCHGPIDALISIDSDGKNLPYTTTVISNGNGTEDRLVLDVEGDNLFGGTNVGGQGGISGTMDVYRGLPTQQPNDYLTRVQGRVVVDQSTGLGYVFAGVGNGTMSFLSGGAEALNETITVTRTGFSISLGQNIFSVDGTVSGHIGTAHSEVAFSNRRINFTISTGTTQFQNGDVFTIVLVHSHAAPAYKNICYAVMERMYVGTSAYPKPIRFIVRRCPDPFAQGAGVANINGNANGVLAIYDLMSNAFYGRGITAAKFDVSSFMATAVVIAAEGLGLSFQIDAEDTADTIIGEILRHIDGVVYTDPATGLWTLKLARADYDPATIPVLDPSAIESIDFARGSWAETTNSLVIAYLSRAANFNDRTVFVYDRANISASGQVRSKSIDFKYVADRTTASLIGMRALKTMGFPIGKLKIGANRKAWNYRMGGVFKLNWPPLGIVGMIFRITHIGYGQVSDGHITIDSVEDIFGIQNTAFVSPPESGWVNPLGAPAAPSQQRLFEAPYPFLTEAALPLGRYAMGLAARGDASSKSFQVWNVETTPVESVDFADFTPIGTLTALYAIGAAFDTTVGFTLQNLLDTDAIATLTDGDFAAGKLLVLIDDEILACQTVTTGVGTLAISNIIRGVLDTLPAPHAINSVVWFISQGTVTTRSVPVLSDITMSSKLLPENSFGVYPIGSATQLNLATNSRYLRPFPPGNLRIGALAWGIIPATVTGDLVMTWAIRNRLTQSLMVRQDAGDFDSGEPGQTFTVKIYIANVLIHTFVGIGTGYTYTAIARVTDDPDITKAVKIEIFSNANTLDSLFAQSFTTHMSGPSGTLGPGRYEFTATEIGGLLL